ncbi:MAG: hypothetical protein WC139_02905 [Candidatus Kapaibacterium sp.]
MKFKCFNFIKSKFIKPKALESNWEVKYDGFGKITIKDEFIILKPKVSTAENETHAALVTTIERAKDFTLEIDAITKYQLRENTPPNAWEVFWIFFNYNPTDDGKKKTNYFLLKPNGYELGTAWDEVEQGFSDTGDTMNLSLGEEYKYVITKAGRNLRISVNDIVLIDKEFDADKLYDETGCIGLYSEDAEVEIKRVEFVSND